MSTTYPATLLADFYKISHRNMYPAGTEVVYSTWIPRESRLPGITEAVAFGFQGFVQEYLVNYFNDNFFNRNIEEIVAEYSRLIKFTLGIEAPEADHLCDLHALGYLPLEVKAVPEGTRVPLRVPMATVENTDPRFFWLTNYIETLWSAELWHSATSATTSAHYRTLLDKWALETTGSTAGVEFQAHDFSMRGMTSLESAAKSGAGHLLSFVGTDTIPAISYLEEYYGANIEQEMVGTSIPASEHSVMCAYGQDEYESYKHLITNVHPNGFVSLVSDTYDLFSFLTKTLPRLKDEVMTRDGRVVIRPDSGDPADIICGYGNSLGYINSITGLSERTPAEKGVIELLWETFGGTVNELGFKVLDPHIGAIYGDSITPARAEDICARLATKGFASTNIVFGIGSYTFQYCTRDSLGFAMKSTWVKIAGEGVHIFKDPATDTNKVKKSLKGRCVVLQDETGVITAVDGLGEQEQKDYPCILQTIFYNGVPSNVQTLAEVRARVAGL